MGGTAGITSWRDVWTFIKKQLPNVFVTGKFNFITIHYFYIIGMAILLSVIMYGIGGIAYIDALFFTSGSCTQSGLNTVNVNDIATGQQVVLFLGAMFCNPIVIHSSVVFVRLYWFEKRFEDVVREARSIRRTKSKGRTFSTSGDDVERGETGGRNKAVNFVLQTGRKMSLKNKSSKSEERAESQHEKQPDRPQGEEEESRSQQSPGHSRADSLDGFRLPQLVSTEQHIRFLENQRNPKDDVTLYIPSPREYDRGGRPENLDEHLEDDLLPQMTKHSDDQNNIEPRPRQIATHLTFNEPEILRDRPRTGYLPPRLNQKRFPTGGSATSGTVPPKRTFTGNTLKRSATGKTAESMPYLSYQATVGRNSFFVNLTEEQREELGGIEYRALKTLALILIGYFFFFHIFGIICLTPWIYHTSYGNVVTEDGQGRGWWGVFTATSAFNDLGFTLTPDSMISFDDATFPLLIMTFLIVIGNTGFPCMLRFTIWAISIVVPVGGGLWEELQFLLDHPRRCFTLLFPQAATWWLFAILVILNGLDLLFFVILDLDNTAVSQLSGWEKFMDGLFQAASTRTAGFSVVNLAALHPAIQVSYLIMMYISAFPIAISMRRTNVYEERSLGIYAAGEDEDDMDKEPSYVGAHIRKQLSFDLWYIFLGLFIIAIVEGDRLENTNEYAFTTFSCLFEIVSAYGTVGLSLGYPTTDASFSAEFRTLSKLVIIAMQVRGRHRGLPYGLDRAVLLPSENLHEKERKEAERMINRRPSLAMSMTSAVDGQIESEKFRPETGLSTGIEPGYALPNPRERRFTGWSPNHSKPLTEMQSPTGPARRELGTAMFKLASASDAIKDGLANRSSSSGS